MRYWHLGFLLLTLALLSCSPHQEIFQGYIEGRYIYLASPEDGTLKALALTRGQQVKAGQTAFILDPQPQAAVLAQAEEAIHHAEAEVAQAEANLALSTRTYQRQHTLWQQKVISQEQWDTAQRNLATDTAALTAAQANLANTKAAYVQAAWSREQKVIEVPADGVIFDTYYLAGEFVPAGRPIASLLPPQEIKAIFFVPEKILGTLQLGETIHLSCDHCAAANAVISYISPSAEYTPPVIYSQTRREHLSYRVEADLPVTQAVQFHPGQPVDVMIPHDIHH